MTSLRLHSGYPLKGTKWRVVQEIDQEIDTAFGLVYLQKYILDQNNSPFCSLNNIPVTCR